MYGSEDNTPSYPHCDLDQRPNDGYILSLCGHAVHSQSTPNEVATHIMMELGFYLEREWLVNRCVTIQLNWMLSGFVWGCGNNFPFEAK